MKEKYWPETLKTTEDPWQGHTVRDGCLKRPNFCEVLPTDEWKNLLAQKDNHHKDILMFVKSNENNPIREIGKGASFLVSDLYRGSLVRIEKKTINDHEKSIADGAFYGIWDLYQNHEDNTSTPYLHLFEYQNGILRYDTSEGIMALRYDIGKPKHLLVRHKEHHSFKLELVTKLDVLRIGFGQKAPEAPKQSWLGARIKPVLGRMRS